MLFVTVLLVLFNISLVFCALANQTSYHQHPPKCEDATVFKCKYFSEAEDARALRRSLKYTYNAEATLQLLLNRANSQRQDITSYLKKHFDINLSAELDSLFLPVSYTRKLLTALISEPKDYLAACLFEAMDGPGTSEDVLIEILCSRKTNEEINDIKDAFRKRYDKSLEQKVYDDTSGNFMNLLMDLLYGTRKSENTPVDEHSTRKLINLIATSKGHNRLFESSIVTIFSRESFRQLYHVIINFSKVAGQTIQQCIEESSGDPDYNKALLAIVDSVTNLPRYYAKRLYDAMDGLGTNNPTLIRIVAIRSEIDMGCIKKEFETLYGATLKSAIQDDTSGLFSDALTQLIEDKKPTNCTPYPIS